jgi:acyl-CoA synthetase (AMP-forming)/AMP-acid ligase II
LRTMIVRSPEPPVEIPDVPLTSLLLARAEALGDKPALIDGASGRTYTFAQWAQAVRAAAAGLAARGLRQGEVFAIFSPNVPEYAIAFHAVSLIGGVVTTINPLYTAAELAYQLKDAGAVYLLTVGPFLDKARQAAAECGLRELFVLGEAEGATPFAVLMAGGAAPPDVRIDAADVVAMPYSSGTTGLSKGVMLTHRNLVANIVQCQSAFDALSPDDRVLAILPFFHIYGLSVIMNLGLYLGTTIVTLPRFEMESFLQAIQTHRITYGYLVPPIVLGLAKHPLVEKFDLGSLRVVFSGAAPLGAELAAAASARLKVRVLQGYGLTETSPVTHCVRVGSVGGSGGSVGQPLPNTESTVVDVVTGAELGPRQEGEIWIRGPQVMKGYLNRPEATAAMIDAEGWLHSGDIGYFDEEGNFFIVDRVKELIKYKGLQIAPAELEALLISHPAVADAAVIPIPDDEAGQVPKGFVVLKGEATAAEIMAFVAERVAPFKKLRQLEVIEQIPKSASGKILRRLLVDRERAASQG